jgi:hypothetical protein
MYCYDTSSSMLKNDGAGFDPLRCNATRCYLDHYQNFLTLTFFADNGSVEEKAQARKELIICDRKMRYWKRQPHFSAKLSIEGRDALNRQWKGRYSETQRPAA